MTFKKDVIRVGLVCSVALLATLRSLPALGGNSASSDEKQFRILEAPLDVTDFGEGWTANVKYPESKGVLATECQLWVEDGWLHASRVSEVGVEWRLALAKTSAGMAPRAFQYENRPAIKITYADGKYFIRDNSVVLRALRPPFDKERPTFGVKDVLHTKVKPGGYCGSELNDFYVSSMSEVSSDMPWYCAMSGPSREAFNFFIRLNPHELRKPRHGFGNFVDGQRRAFHGDAWAFDDGELLIAFYRNPILGRMLLNEKKVSENMADGNPPEIDAAQWFNVEDALSLNALKGKVVLLDFWATTCGPCIKKLPEVQKLHDKYAEQGLAVIAIHMAETLGACEKFLDEHDYTFPFMLDSGKTAESYGVSSNPTYFLISREGKVVTGYDTAVPSAELIESLLKQ